MSWVYLFTAGLFEIGWPVGLKWAQEPGRPLVGIVWRSFRWQSAAHSFSGAEGDRARHGLCGMDRHRRRRDLFGRGLAVWRPEQPRPLSRRRADHRRRGYTEAGPLNKIGGIFDGAFEARDSSAGPWRAATAAHAGACQRPASAQTPLTPEAALQQLIDGNGRFAEGRMTSFDEDLGILKAKTVGQAGAVRRRAVLRGFRGCRSS